MIELNVPEAGLTGVAFVLPVPANPAARGGHRVYLKRMLLAESAEGLLPEWAFFARCVVDTTELRPTASREALYEDGLLDTVREALGDQLRGWLVRLAARDPRPAGRSSSTSTTSASRRWPCTTTRCCAWSTSGGRSRPTSGR